MKKNDYFIDVSAYQAADLTSICQQAGTRNTIIKVSEGTSWLSPVRVQQTQTSNCVGYYHFARFGGNVVQAQAEADFFITNLPAKVTYLVCDYEDSASGNRQANTNAVLAFMDKCKAAGYQPIYYSYKPFTLANVDYTQIIAKYPNSLWIAAYPNYEVTPEPVWSVFPSLDGIRWWQFTSVGIAGGLDKNIVLLDDDQSDIVQEILKGMKNNMDYTIAEKSGKYPYIVVTNGVAARMKHLSSISAFQKAGAKDISLETEDYQSLVAELDARKPKK